MNLASKMIIDRTVQVTGSLPFAQGLNSVTGIGDGSFSAIFNSMQANSMILPQMLPMPLVSAPITAKPAFLNQTDYQISNQNQEQNKVIKADHVQGSVNAGDSIQNPDQNSYQTDNQFPEQNQSNVQTTNHHSDDTKSIGDKPVPNPQSTLSRGTASRPAGAPVAKVATTGMGNSDSAQPAKTTESSPLNAPQPVKMADIINSLNLTDQQVSALATAMHLSVDELKKMQLQVQRPAQNADANATSTLTAGMNALINGILPPGIHLPGNFGNQGQPEIRVTAIMGDGKKIDLASFFNDANAGSASNGGQAALSGQRSGTDQVLGKISNILGLDQNQSNEFFSALNISSLEIKGMNTVAPRAEQTDGVQQPTVKTGLFSPMQTNGIFMQISSAERIGGNPTGNETGQGLNGEPHGIFPGGQVEKGDSTKIPFPSVQNDTSNTGISSLIGAQQPISQPFGATMASGASSMAKTGANAAVMGQIIEKATILNLPHATETKISLSPESLGSVSIKLSMADSSVNASIVVESHAVKQVVEQNLGQLKDALHRQGISVDEMSVSVGQQGGGFFDSRRNAGQGPSNVEGLRGTENDVSRATQTMKLASEPGRRRTINSLVDLTA